MFDFWLERESDFFSFLNIINSQKVKKKKRVKKTIFDFLGFSNIIKYLLFYGKSTLTMTNMVSAWLSNSKKIFILSLLLFAAGIWYCVYLFLYTQIWNKMMAGLEEEVKQLEQKSQSFYASPDFEKFSFAKKIEDESMQMPRSDHIEAVSEIFDSVVDVEWDSYNIELSDFKISLDQISLRGFVTNLKILYNAPEKSKKPSLIQRFQDLGFLHDIAIQTYDQAQGGIGYDFVLTAKVENNYDK